MSTISKAERKQLMKQGEQARMLYRWGQALPYAVALLALISFGVWVLQ